MNILALLRARGSRDSSSARVWVFACVECVVTDVWEHLIVVGPSICASVRSFLLVWRIEVMWSGAFYPQFHVSSAFWCSRWEGETRH